MKSPKSLPTLLTLLIALACFHISVVGQSADAKFASVNSSGLNVRFDMAIPGDGTVTISTPDGRIFRKEFSGGSSEFSLNDQGERLPDGQYNYELRISPAFSAMSKKAALAARGKDDDPESVRAARKRVDSPQGMVQSGSFSVVNGVVIVAGAVEERGGIPEAPPKPTRRNAEPEGASVTRAALTKIRQHHIAFRAMPDQVIPDDLIVQGSACVGLDCVNGEVFDFDTVRLKENNTRLQFDDTSTAQGFPTNNWQIRANSSGSGGGSFLGFVDQGASGTSESGTIVMELDAGAPSNSVRVASNGKVGFRTGTPVLDLHVTTSDTPAHRLEQTNAGGFTAQTWDIAGNEANFFVRDVTSGSRLPFRIRPGAPTSSIDIGASGAVGISNSSPLGTLHSKGQGIFFDDSAGAISGGIYANPLASSPFTLWSGAGDFRIGTGVTDRVVGTGFTERLRVLSSGNVGINTAAPTDTLSVNGTASKPGGGSWAVFSDERLKNVKGSFNRGLSALMQLQPIRYEYTRNNALGLDSAGEHIGFGAQAVQKVLPEAISTTSGGYLQVNNDPIIWTMLNAIKEQQKEIEDLKAEVKKLRGTRKR